MSSPEGFKHNWYAEFFKGAFNELWRKSQSESHTAREADFLEAELKLSPEASVLDVPCGNGRLALELARRGYQVTGVDISSEFIAEARAPSDGLPVQWRCADMAGLAGLNLPIHDAAYCMGNSFGYLPYDGMVQYLKAVRACLKDGGAFVFDTVMAAESVLPNWEEREWWQVEDIRVLVDNTYHAAESLVETRYTFLRAGHPIEEQTLWHHVYTLAEIKRMLAAAGFEVSGVYSSLDKQEFRKGDGYLVVVGGESTNISI